MNSLFSRIILMAALLSIFNIASASDGLLDIEVSPNHLIDEEQPTTETGEQQEGTATHGDLLEIETRTQSISQTMSNRELVDIKLPSKGMSKSKVKRDFGNPVHINPAVGKPPISSWVYDNYTVYFEHEWVIHSVLNKK
ncbi:MAG: hypothetical protein OEL79_07115 [Chromatiales bacterium]|nr:hypothetical protein [Chromatiales bacterium]